MQYLIGKQEFLGNNSSTSNFCQIKMNKIFLIYILHEVVLFIPIGLLLFSFLTYARSSEISKEEDVKELKKDARNAKGDILKSALCVILIFQNLIFYSVIHVSNCAISCKFNIHRRQFLDLIIFFYS